MKPRWRLFDHNNTTWAAVIIKRNFQHQKKILWNTPCVTTWLIKITIHPNMLSLQCAVFTCCKVLFTLFFAVTGIVKLSFVTALPWSASFFSFCVWNIVATKHEKQGNLLYCRNSFSIARALMFMISFDLSSSLNQCVRSVALWLVKQAK